MSDTTHSQRIYLDHAAATPLLPEVYVAMTPYFQEDYGNASAIHAEGIRARQALHDARARVATALKVKPDVITFTSNGTESNNLAILGSLEARVRSGNAYSSLHVITTPLEHPSVTEALRYAAMKGVVVHEVAVGEDGLIRTESLQALLTPQTALVTFAYANSEIGVVQPVHRLVRMIRERAPKALVHVDAAQAPLWLPCEPTRLGVDLLSLDAGKCGGPKGVGILVGARDLVVPQLYGGGQEAGLRPGTEPVPLVVGASIALMRAQEGYVARSEAVARVRDAGLRLLQEMLPNAVVNGSAMHRLPNNINVSLPGFNTEYAVVYLDAHGVAASTRSACAGSGGGESSVVRALTNDGERARSTIRLTLGTETTIDDLEYTFKTLQQFCMLQNFEMTHK